MNLFKSNVCEYLLMEFYQHNSIIKNVSSSTSHKKIRFSIFTGIFRKRCMNDNIMKTQIFHKVIFVFEKKISLISFSFKIVSYWKLKLNFFLNIFMNSNLSQNDNIFKSRLCSYGHFLSLFLIYLHFSNFKDSGINWEKR